MSSPRRNATACSRRSASASVRSVALTCSTGETRSWNTAASTVRSTVELRPTLGLGPVSMTSTPMLDRTSERRRHRAVLRRRRAASVEQSENSWAAATVRGRPPRGARARYAKSVVAPGDRTTGTSPEASVGVPSRLRRSLVSSTEPPQQSELVRPTVTHLDGSPCPEDDTVSKPAAPQWSVLRDGRQDDPEPLAGQVQQHRSGLGQIPDPVRAQVLKRAERLGVPRRPGPAGLIEDAGVVPHLAPRLRQEPPTGHPVQRPQQTVDQRHLGYRDEFVVL